MNKKELKNGSVVELRNKRRYIVVENTLLDLTDFGMFLRLCRYTNSLYYREEGYTGNETSSWDIMKVNNNVPDEPNDENSYNEAMSLVFTEKNGSKRQWTWRRPKETKYPTSADLHMLKTMEILYPNLKYIARDEDGDLCGFIEKPQCIGGMWMNKRGENDYDLSGLNKMFTFIREDEEKYWSLEEIKSNEKKRN